MSQRLLAVLSLLSFSAYSFSSSDVNPLRWTHSFGPSMSFGDPALSADQSTLAVFVFNATYTGIAVMSTETGNLQWQQQIQSTTQAQSGWVVYGEGENREYLYAGTSRGIVSLELESGRTHWEYIVPTNFSNYTQQQVPAHPTYIADRIFFTFEAGVNSSQMMVLNATTGRLQWCTEELVVTLIWPVRAVSGVGYCGWDVQRNDIACTVRSFTGQVLWAKRNLTYTDPGLWDNPNLVVDARGDRTFMFSKPGEQLRVATGFDSHTGNQLWSKPAYGDVDDYDTYAWDGMYFRLMTVLGSNDTQMVVQMIDGPSGKLEWSQQFGTNTDCILLVGGGSLHSQGYVVVTGMTENKLFGFDAASGAQLWTYNTNNSPTTGVLDKDGWLYFGDGTGMFQAISANHQSISTN